MESFTYLGIQLSSADGMHTEQQHMMGIAGYYAAHVTYLEAVTPHPRLHLYMFLVVPILLYGNKDYLAHLQAFYMTCQRRIL